MQRSILTCAFFLLTSAAFAQQQQPANPSDPYQGQSNPPSDDVIVTTQQDQPQPTAKPHPGKPLVQPPQSQPQPQTQAQEPADTQPQDDAQPAPSPAQPAAADNAPADSSAPIPANSSAPPVSGDTAANSDPDVNGTDDGIVGVARDEQQTGRGAPGLTARGSLADSDPDGDIVNPHPLAPGQLPDGTTIRVRLLSRLSSAQTQQGEVFRTRVASDVLQDGQVLIPTGAEIDGRVVQVSPGTSRSHGTMLLRPDTVILSNGSRYRLDAQVTGTPGSNAHVSGEGFIDPGSRIKKDSMEYGGAVGGGVIVGALIGGPVGAVTGGLIGAGAMTVRVMTNHSDATLEPGTVMLFTLDNRLDLQAANPTGN